jgi:hypothetical protein
MPGKGSERFAKALKTASGGKSKRLRQARHVQRSMEKQGLSKERAAKAAMAAAKGHLRDGMSLEAALETALSELELPSEYEEEAPYPGSDPRYEEEGDPDRPRGYRTAYLPPEPKKEGY